MALAVTTMVVLAFLIPLALLVRDLAEDRAMTSAERDAESIARFLAALGAAEAVSAVGGAQLSEFDVSVVFPDDSVFGAPVPPDESLEQARSGAATLADLDDGRAVYVPVVQPDGSSVVVRVFVQEEELRSGVAQSWLTLGLLGLVLVAIAVMVSDRLGRSVVDPARALQRTAARLGEGDLEARVDPAGPEEIRAVGIEFNRLAGRVDRLLQQERETAADLSHRLRTPLTAVRLDAESLPDGARKRRLVDDLDDLERHVDFVIREARREVRRDTGGASDLAAILSDRVGFWSALAEEQRRPVELHVPPNSVEIAIPPPDVEAMVDALIGNVFAHTNEEAALAVRLVVGEGLATLIIEDAGTGFADDSVLERGRSGGAGTGLGLDIARRTATSAGGDLRIGSSDRLGGAAVTVTFPIRSG